jgi:signal transduction histidine kinase/ligand-binding sensor domain-containing protein
MKNRCFIPALILLFTTFSTWVFSQKNQYTFKHLSTADGLSNANVNAILQDETGFMWFATNEGLNRYDGYEFRVYKHIPEDSLSLSGNRIENIYLDSDGKLWVCTANGLCLYNSKKDNFIRSPLHAKTGQSLSNKYVRQILEANGYYWVTTLGGGINRYNPKTNTLEYYRHKENDSTSLSLDWVWTVFQDSRNRLWFGTMGEGLNLLVPGTDQFQRYHFEGENAALNTIRCIYELADNVFLLGTDDGLLRFTLKDDTLKYYRYKHEEDDPASISGGHIKDIFRDSEGNLWIANQYGLDIYDEEKDKFIHIKSKINDINSISTDEIWDIDQDNQGNVWFGTYKGGVNVLDLGQKHFKSWQHDSHDPKSLNGNSLLSFEERNDNRLWIGIDRGGLSLFDRDNGTIKTFIHEPDNPRSLSANAVLSLLIDNQNQLWAGTWAGGLNKFNEAIGIFEHFSAPPIYDKQWHVWDILQDSKGRIWTASARGLSRLDPGKSQFITYEHQEGDNKSLSHNACWALMEDSNNRIWIGTSAGLNAYNESSDDFTFYPYQTEDSLIKESYTVYSIFEDSRGRKWVGGNINGLNLLDEQNNAFSSYTEKDELCGNVVYSIEEDGKNNLWLATNKGLTQIHIDTDGEISKIYNFNDKPYLTGTDFNIGASLKSKTGELFFGSNKGFIFFHPDSIQPNTHKPKVVLTGLQIYNEEVPIAFDEKYHSPLSKALPETRKITLNHKQSIFTLQYAALNYSSPEKTQYAYKLEGLEKKWNKVGNKRYATYTNLDAGEYTFMVKAANNIGLWNDTPTKLKITVLPPWYKTWWWKVFVALSLIMIVFIIFRVRLKYLRKQKTILKQRVKERTHELEELNAQLDHQNKEITTQNIEINQQKEELELYQNHLEDLVTARTEELEKAKRKAEESDRLKTSFLANMSHEIRTPLNAIVGFSTFLTSPEIDWEDKKGAVQIINTNTEALLQLIDDILDLSMIESNQLRIIKQQFRINDHLNSVYNELKHHKGDKNISFILENNLQNEDIILNSDPNRIRQVIVNLVNNAFKFTEKGEIKLSLTKQDNEIVYTVSDTGAGIAKNHLNLIFERFRKIDQNTKKIFRGSGLGLAISKYISSILGGKLWVESEEGKGSVFYFAIPTTDAKENFPSYSCHRGQ